MKGNNMFVTLLAKLKKNKMVLIRETVRLIIGASFVILCLNPKISISWFWLGLFLSVLIPDLVGNFFEAVSKSPRMKSVHTQVPLKHSNALSSIMKTHKDAYKFSQDKDSLIAFLVYTYLGGDEIRINDDMARLIEKQLRMKDFFLDIGLNSDKTALLPANELAELKRKHHEEAEIYTWIPLIDTLESLNEGATCLDIKRPSITLAKARFNDEMNFHNVIACPVNEYYSGSDFTKDQILIIDQDRYVNEVIQYKNGEQELTIRGKLLFAVTNFNEPFKKQLTCAEL